MSNNNSIIQELTWNVLRKAGRDIPIPFQFTLNDNSTLVCEEIKRLLPKKRIVAFGTWEDKPIVAKIFFEPGNAKRHFERELNGIEMIKISGVHTPTLLWKGSIQKDHIHILIFERIMDAINLEILWKKKRSLEELLPLMQSVTIELATQHVLGVVQRDLHLNNFIVTDKQIYTLDAASINFTHEILPKAQSIDHLALFFAQLGVGTEKFQEKLFQTYVQARSWIVKPTDIELLRRSTIKWAQKRWERYEKKIKRNSSSFARFNTTSRLIMCDREYESTEFNQFLKNPEAYFSHEDTKVLKAGRSSTVVKIKINDRYFVVKRYNIKSVWHWLRRCLRETRAATSWNLTQLLSLFGIPTAKPVAFIEQRFLGLRGKSYFVMEFVEGVHAGNYFANYREDDPIYATMATRILTVFINLVHLSLTHGDLKMTNILIEDQRPILIDLDGMIEHHTKIGLKRAFRQEMRRFMKNWENNPSVYTMFENLIGPMMK